MGPARAGCRLTGSLVDQEERLLFGLALELRPCPSADERAEWRTAIAAEDACGPAVAVAVVGNEGFSFGDVPAGGWAVFVAGTRDVPAAARLFRVGSERARHLGLVLPRGLAIRGRVVGPEGAPASGAVVSLVGLDAPFLARGPAGDDGAFRFAPLLPGRYRVESQGLESHTKSARVVLAGEDELLLQLSFAGVLNVRLLDEGRRPLSGRVELRGPSRQDGAGSEVRFAHVEPGLYDLLARAPDGSLGVVQGLWVSPGLVPVPVEMVLRPAAPVRLALGEQAVAHAWRASWQGTLVQEGELSPGTEVSLLLPPGRVQVSWFDLAAGGEPVLSHIDERVLAGDQPPVRIEYGAR